MSWTIYSKAGVHRVTISELEYNGLDMGERSITFSLTSAVAINFDIGDYLMYRGERFELNYRPAKAKRSTPGTIGDAFKYDSVKMNSLADELVRCEFLDYVPEGVSMSYSGGDSFSFYCASVANLAERIKRNLDRIYTGAQAWTVTVAEGTTSEEKMISCQSLNCFNALEFVSSEFELRYKIVGRTITIGGTQEDISGTLTYGEGNGLYELAQATNQEALIITRLRAYGSERNMPYRYYNSLKDNTGAAILPEMFYVKNLMLPGFGESKTTTTRQITHEGVVYTLTCTPDDVYIDSAAVDQYGVREGRVIFDGSGEEKEIYPSLEGMTKDKLLAAGITVTLDAGDNGNLDEVKSYTPVNDSGVLPEEGTGELQATFTMKIKDVGFNINDYLSTAGSAMISMKSGMCIGREFEIGSVTKVGNDYQLVCNRQIDDDIDMAFPNLNFPLAVGDKFILYNIDMPAAYIKVGAEELLTNAIKFHAKNDKEKYTYTPSIDEIFMGNSPDFHDQIREGQKFSFYDPDLGVDVAVTIKNLTIREGGSLPTYQLTLDDEVESGTLTKVINSLVEQSNASSTGGTGGSNIKIIALNDRVAATDKNVYSARRSHAEHLSKKNDDSANGRITFNAGATFKSAEESGEIQTGAMMLNGESGLSDVVDESGFQTYEVANDPGGTGASSLADLYDVDESVNYANEGDIFSYVNGFWGARASTYIPQTTIGGETINTVQDIIGYINKYGGGGGGAATITLTATSDQSVVAIAGETVKCSFNFTSLYTSDSTSTGDGTLKVIVNDAVASTQVIHQGANQIDVTAYLGLGDNVVQMSVTDSLGNNRIISYVINSILFEIQSSFNYTQLFDSTISFRYTPVGAVEKTVTFKVDGTVVATKTLTSQSQQTQVLPAQTYGVHTIEVSMAATIEGEVITSNLLYYQIRSIASAGTSVIIASNFNLTAAVQYESVTIPYLVYDPASANPTVELYVNGVKVSTVVVDSTEQYWTYRFDEPGQYTLGIVSGGTTVSFSLAVAESDIVIEAETNNLDLFLNAYGRSNSESNKSSWTFGAISCQLTGFNYSSNGWIGGALRLNGNARLVIPFNVFDKDFRANGKTIEIEMRVSQVTDIDAIVMSCMDNNIGMEASAQKFTFKSELESVIANYKADEIVRISIVVEERSSTRLILCYLNGIPSKITMYSQNDNFMQRTPKPITIGSNDCQTDIFKVRIYDTALSRSQVLDNYIADMEDVDKKLKVYKRNDIFNSYGQLMYNAVRTQIPCLIITGNLPQYKGNKITCRLDYEDYNTPSNSFVAIDAQNDVQGTSSAAYPVKNFKFKFHKTNGVVINGTPALKYPLRPGSIPVNCFCLKADYAESSGTHNTGTAVLVHRVTKEMGLLTPPQQSNEAIRTTIDGFPIVVFNRQSVDSPIEFVGKYNFNNDKSTQETFGFVSPAECWELRNNTSDRVLFKVSDYSTPDWMNDFEARFPDDDALNAQYAAGAIPTNLKRLTDWIVSCKDNPTKFKNEASQYFNITSLVFYALFTDLMAMVDQCAKNMFLTTFDGTIWWLIFYDNDTIMGINNEGDIAFNWDVEFDSVEGTGYVYNGRNSVLWNLTHQAFGDAMQAMYYDLRNRNIASYERFVKVYNEEQAERWNESLYGLDAMYKYVNPLINDGNGAYLYAAQGSRQEHRKWWLYNRFKYIDSKYMAGDYLIDRASFRLYTPETWAGVAPCADFTITPFQGQYFNVQYGSYWESSRGYKDVPFTITAPDIVFNDTETYVYGISNIKSLGDLSPMYCGTVDMSKAVNLVDLIVGSRVAGYNNENLRTLTLGNNIMLRKIDVSNCPNLAGAMDATGCTNITEVYAAGSGLTTVNLPNGGIMEKIYYPASTTNITIKKHPYLTVLNYAGLAVSTLVMEELSGVNMMQIVETWLNSATSPNRLRVTGFDITRTNFSLMALIDNANLGGEDDYGYSTTSPVLRGTFRIPRATYADYNSYSTTFPDVNFIAGEKVTPVSMIDSTAQSLALAKWGQYNILATVDLAAVTTLGQTFKGNTSINNLSDFGSYFTGLQQLSTDQEWGNGEFRGCTALQRINIGSVKTLGTYTFYDCTSLRLIEAPSLTTVGDYGARRTEMLPIVELPSLTTVQGRAMFYATFAGNATVSGLSTTETDFLIVPNGKSAANKAANPGAEWKISELPANPKTQFNIGGSILVRKYTIYSEFRANTTLTSIECPYGVGSYSFYGCTNLVTATGTPYVIWNYAFRDCTKLATIDLSKAVYVGEESLRNTAITTANMPEVTYLNYFSLYGCSALTSIYLEKIRTFGGAIGTTFPALQSVVINNATVPTATGAKPLGDYTGNIYVPDAVVNNYKTATNWSYYANQFKPISQQP